MQTQDFVILIVKYLLEGLAVAAAAYWLSNKKTDLSEVGMIGLTAATIFLLLDMFAPSVGASSRTGAGVGIGLQRVGYEGFANAKAAKRKAKKVRFHNPPATANLEAFRY